MILKEKKEIVKKQLEQARQDRKVLIKNLEKVTIIIERCVGALEFASDIDEEGAK